ncbi:MAG: LON peptidase substrate-binding domain-containing protein [Proteobacteria bacterium]|nr:LON peptidase substrate-binding domain-containing protein [Pseudomonadota bacterium]
MDSDALASLPLFVLPMAMLPGQSTPLHVFEPRYQAMVADVLEGNRLLGIATLLRRSDASLDQADVYPVVAVAKVLTHQPLDHGRSNILLRYEARVRILEENALHANGFRTAKVEEIPALEGDVPQAAWIRALLAQMAPSSAAAQTSFQRLAAREDGEMLRVLADLALTSVEDRVCFLEAATMSVRGELVQRRLAERVAATLEPAGEA